MTTVDEARAALLRGRPVVLVTPPAPDQAGALWEVVGAAGDSPRGSPAVVIVCADEVAAAEWGAAAPTDRRVHVVTGLRRSERCLRDLPIDVLAGTVADLSALLARSALKLEAVSTIVVAWPELLVTTDQAAALDTLLGAAPDAHRVRAQLESRRPERLPGAACPARRDRGKRTDARWHSAPTDGARALCRRAPFPPRLAAAGRA